MIKENLIIGAITGGIAEAYYKTIPDYIIENVLKILPDELVKILEDFSSKYGRNWSEEDKIGF